MLIRSTVLIKDDELLQNFNKIWDKSSNSIEILIVVIVSDSGPVYNEKYIQTNIKPYKGKINTNFHDNGLSKEDSHCICLSVISVDSIFKMGKRIFFSSVFRRIKYIIQEKKINKYINNGLEISSDDSEEDFNEEDY